MVGDVVSGEEERSDHPIRYDAETCKACAIGCTLSIFIFAIPLLSYLYIVEGLTPSLSASSSAVSTL